LSRATAVRHASWMSVLLISTWAAGFGLEPRMPGDAPPPRTARLADDPKDWPMYNRDVIGTRHNPAEKAPSPANVNQMVERWRFPPEDSRQEIGVVHATVVVNGYVYFGTETTPTVYKLTPDGRVKWTFPPRGEARTDEPRPQREGLPVAGF